MDHKTIFDNFKKQYMADGYFPFSLFPVLFLELVKYGANKSIITESFMNDFRESFIPGESTGVYLKATDCIIYYTNAFLPAPVVNTEAVKKPVVEVKKEEEAIIPPAAAPVQTKQISGLPEKPDDDNYIPTDEEEGDGTYIPESERLYLKPEECASKQYDWDFIKRVGAIPPGDDE